MLISQWPIELLGMEHVANRIIDNMDIEDMYTECFGKENDYFMVLY